MEVNTMSEEFGDDIITVIDDDGTETNLEVLDTLEYNGTTYGAFLPADMKEDDPDYGIIILKITEDENGEEIFEDIESDEELNEIYEKFMVILFDDEEDEPVNEDEK